MSTTPTALVECAFFTDPTSLTPSWRDVSSYVRGFSTRRGRQTELDRIEAGTASVVLSNLDARFNPDNTSGPYYGGLKPMRAIRVRAIWPTVTTRNLLTTNQASFETDTTGWTGGTRSTAQAADGSASLALTSVGATSMNAQTPSGTSAVAIEPSTQYTCLISFRAATVSQNVRAYLRWFNAAGTDLTVDVSGSSVSDSSSAWTQATVTATSPATAVYAQIFAIVNNAAGAGEVHYIDKVSLHAGSSTTWVAPPTYYPIFSGFVTSWPQEYPGGKDSVASIQCVDGFRTFNLNSLATSEPLETTGNRIQSLLNACGWPNDPSVRDLDAGQSTVQAISLDGGALSHLQDVATSEGGLFFMSRSGVATFFDRAAVLTTALNTALTWGDGGGSELAYLDVSFVDSEVTLWNDIDVTAPALTTQTSTDATSQASYFARNLVVSTQLTTIGHMQDRGAYALARYKDPATRVSPIVVTGMSDTTQWPSILGRELADKIRVIRRPPGSGSTLTQDSNIEGIAFTVTQAGLWSITWNLSPVGGSTNYLVLDDPVNGLLDANLVSY